MEEKKSQRELQVKCNLMLTHSQRHTFIHLILIGHVVIASLATY